MNFDSPSNVLKNIEQFFGTTNSPDSPCANPKHFTKKPLRASSARLVPLATRNLNTLKDFSDTKYDSPTSTLAADLSENFHIAESTQSFKQHKQLSKRPPLFSKMDSVQPNRSSFNSESSRSSRATSNASISSVCSFSSFSSIESTSSATLQASPVLQPSSHCNNISRKPLRRAITTSGNTIRSLKSFQSMNYTEKFSFGQIDLNDEDETGDMLDRLCVPSPIMERTLVIEDEQEEESETVFDLNKREVGSPIQKKPVRSKVRRIHSMFYSKKEITDTTNLFGNLMNSNSPNLDKILDASEDNDNECLSNSILHKSKIETFNVKNDSIPRINVGTLCKILDGHYKEFFDEVTIVDCRFEYEYKGGHINGSVNVSSQRELEEKFLNKANETNNFQTKNKKKLIVFHCEFSSYRGPLMASHLRKCDRNINQDNYPHLDYPDILILEGGYKTFFDSESHRCYPQKYVEMNDNNHKNLCEKELTRFKRDRKRASSFNNLSFAASVNNNSSMSSVASTNKITHKFHRSSTSGVINFSRRPSLKSQFLEFTRSSIDIHKQDSDDENKPPASLNFAFKFPKPLESQNSNNDMRPPSSTSTNSTTMNSKFAFPQPLPHNDTPMVKKKLSRSLTYNI